MKVMFHRKHKPLTPAHILSSVLIALLWGFILVFFCYPLIWVISSAFKTNAQILSSSFSLPTQLDFSVFAYLFERYNFVGYTINSIITSLGSTLIAIGIYSMGAYVLSKYSFPGRNVFFALFTMTMLVPGHAKTQPIFTLIMQLNLYDSIAGLTLVYISGGLAVTMFILRSTFMSIPNELNEYANIEGANFLQTFLYVNLPIAKSGMVTAGLLMFLNTWNEYYFGSLLTISDANKTLPVALQLFTEGLSYDYTKLFAALVLVITPGILIYIFAQRQVQESLAFSGVKG